MVSVVSRIRSEITWPILPDDYVLPDDPVENLDHPLLASALRQSLITLPALVDQALIVSNFALCAAIDGDMICKAPDWMFVQPVQPWKKAGIRRSYTPHTEGSVPQVVMEFLSETYGEEYSMEFTDRVGKWYFYEQVIQVPFYIIFRPDTGQIEVYQLSSGRYQRQTPDPAGRYLISTLNLGLGVWHGSHDARTGYWLRWCQPTGEWLPWSEEQLAQERERAEQERERAGQERERAEQERQERERVQQMLKAEQLRVQALTEQLRALGQSP